MNDVTTYTTGISYDLDFIEIFNSTRVPGELLVPKDVKVTEIIQRIQSAYKTAKRKSPTFTDMMELIAKGYH